MRNNLKRTISLLLAVVMVLSVLPVMAFAAETYVATATTGIPEGKDISIYSAFGGSVFGSVNAGNISPSAATLTEEGGLVVKEGSGAYRFTKNSDGTYYITYGESYLYAIDSKSLGLSGSAVKGAKWNITAATGGYYIANAEQNYSGKPVYIEYYNSAMKLWSYQSNNDANYVFAFFELPEGADDDHDGRVGADALPAGDRPADGSKIVIYNHSGPVTAGAVDGSSLQAIDSTFVDINNIIPGNGTLIFTVHVDGEYYTFENNGKFLRTSENASDGSNAEEIFFDEVESDYTKWKLQEVEGGYVISNKVATYKNNPVVIEYFNESFQGWTLGGSIDLYAMRFYEVKDELNLGYVLNPTMKLTAQTAYKGLDYEVKVKLDDLTEIKSIKLTASVDGGAEFALTQKSQEHYDYVYGIPGSKLNGSKLTIKGTATNEYGMTYTAETVVDISNEPIILSVSPAANEATLEEKRPEISVNIHNCGTKPTVIMKVDELAVTPTVTANKISYKPTEAMMDGRHVVYVKVVREDGKTVEMTWSFDVGDPGLSLYYGQMHSHTAQYSDGAGTLDDAYTYAQNAKDIDFLIVTDHSNYFDTASTATTTSYYDLSSLTKGVSLSKWEEAKATAQKYVTDDFISAYGYEMTWSGGPGHTNTFNTFGIVSRNNSALNNKTGYAGMHLYNDLMVNANLGLDVDGNPVAEGVKTKFIQEAPVVSQLNHPGTTFGNFDNFAGYTPARDSVICLMEVGNGEGAVGGNAYFPSYSQYDLALSKGWHIAPTNNQDNHKGKWGDANTTRNVILTEDFSETGLYNAMSERRVYATEDQNLRIYYYLNDTIMGSVIPLEDDQEIEKVNVTASISDPDGEGLGKVEVIGENGMTVYSADIAGSTYELKVELNNTDAYYYLRVTQADGDIAVTAPVWVGEATPISAEVTSSANIHLVGEAETITGTVTNSAEAEYSITKVEYTLTVNETQTVVYVDNAPKTVAAGSKLDVAFDFIPTTEGYNEIKVVFTGTYRGKEFKCQNTLGFQVTDPSNMIHVGVDYGHDNYYLSGNYKDSAGNFIQFCANNGVLCEEIKAGEFTYDNFVEREYELIVLTVPYLRKDGKANVYTAEELAALKKYTDNGGSVIICSKSDRENQFDNCADNSNALLEAIGAHSRVVNGIIVDNEMKANEAYRIYFSSINNFNTEHPFIKGAYTSSNAFNTVPDPENQNGFQVYNGAPVEIMEGYENAVEVLINGYSTTWGSHYDGYFDGSAFVPVYDESDEQAVSVKMGDVNVMTYEELPGGGWVVTSGVTFFSNYDIKDDVDYANKFILRNILREMTEKKNGAEVVTPIAEVKKQDAGEFTVDGYVTSNASAYDQDTAFFDCIYIQDKEGNGLNIFPVAGNFCIGMNVRCHGGVTFYCGEVELNLGTEYKGSIRILSDELYEVAPARVTCATAMSDAAIGNLMTVGGKIVEIHKTEGVIDKIYVQDATGIACVFINGYINKDYTGLDNLKVGMLIYATGIGSRDVDETSESGEVFARLRVRTRSEIVLYSDEIEMSFKDVSTLDWFHDAVEYCFNNKLLNGMSDTSFGPQTTLNRAMVATVLHRMAGEPKAAAAAEFSDIAEGTWYSEAVAWAAENGIVNGYNDGTFKPDNKISRQEMATMLARYAKTLGIDISKGADISSYPDAEAVHPWAEEAIAWCVAEGIINGVQSAKGTNLEPAGDATRAQFATIIMRFDLLKKGE